MLSHSSSGSTEAVSGCRFFFVSIFAFGARCACVGSIAFDLETVGPTIMTFGKWFFLGWLGRGTDDLHVVHLGVGSVELVLEVSNLCDELFINFGKVGNGSSVRCGSRGQVGKGKGSIGGEVG